MHSRRFDWIGSLRGTRATCTAHVGAEARDVRSAIVTTTGVPAPFTASAFAQYVRRYNENASSFYVVEPHTVRVSRAQITSEFGVVTSVSASRRFFHTDSTLYPAPKVFSEPTFIPSALISGRAQR